MFKSAVEDIIKKIRSECLGYRCELTGVKPTGNSSLILHHIYGREKKNGNGNGNGKKKKDFNPRYQPPTIWNCQLRDREKGEQVWHKDFLWGNNEESDRKQKENNEVIYAQLKQIIIFNSPGYKQHELKLIRYWLRTYPG